MADKTFQIQDAHHLNISDVVAKQVQFSLTVRPTYHLDINYWPYLTDNGGKHQNTTVITYNNDIYLKCRHQAGYFTGTYQSDVTDRGSSARYLIYVLADISVTGTGTNWNDKIPSPIKWESVQAATKTWDQIFELTEAPTVKINLYYGNSDPPTTKVERMGILSAVVTGRYFMVEIIITDPSNEVNALVQQYDLKFLQ